MSNLDLVNNLNSTQIASIQKSKHLPRPIGDGTIIAPGKFILPELRNIGDRKTANIRSFSRSGQPSTLTAQFKKVRSDIINVQIAADGTKPSGIASINIHLFENGEIRGYDTMAQELSIPNLLQRLNF